MTPFEPTPLMTAQNNLAAAISELASLTMEADWRQAKALAVDILGHISECEDLDLIDQQHEGHIGA